jgi:GPH family glycoside/pentoside/hexuronide:cation symporter
VLALAILVSGAVAPLVVSAAGNGVPGHRAMGLFVAALIVVGTLGVFFGTARTPAHTAAESEPSLRASLAVARRSRPFRMLLICFVIQAAGIAMILAGVKYFADHVLGSPDLGPTVLFTCFVGPALLVMPLWSRLGARWGKLRSYRTASLIFAIGALALGLAFALPAAAIYVVVAVMGAGYAGQQVFGLAMLPDCIAYDTARTGRRQAGVFTGLWTAGETFGLALGPGLYLLVLQLFGYASSTSGVAAAQDSTARLGVLLGFSVVPALVVGLALLFVRGYDLTEERLASSSPAAPGPAGAVGSAS